MHDSVSMVSLGWCIFSSSLSLSFPCQVSKTELKVSLEPAMFALNLYFLFSLNISNILNVILLLFCHRYMYADIYTYFINDVV